MTRLWHWIRVLVGLDDIGWPVVAYAPRDPAADREASQRFDQLIQGDLQASYSRIMDEAIEQYLPTRPTGDPVTPIGIVNFPMIEVGEFPAISPLPQFANIDKLPRVPEIDTLDPERAFRPPEWLIDEYVDWSLTTRKVAGVMDVSREILDPTYGSAPYACTPRGRRRIWRHRYIWRPIAKRRIQIAWWPDLIDGTYADASDWYGDY